MPIDLAHRMAQSLSGVIASSNVRPILLNAYPSRPRSIRPASRSPARVVLKMVDALHDPGTVDDATWQSLAQAWSEQQMPELLMLAGWWTAV